jgi:hypothetical protein
MPPGPRTQPRQGFLAAVSGYQRYPGAITHQAHAALRARGASAPRLTHPQLDALPKALARPNGRPTSGSADVSAALVRFSSRRPISCCVPCSACLRIAQSADHFP